MSIPDEIELPRPEDFCRETYGDGHKCCFLGWKHHLFPELTETQYSRFTDITIEVAEEMGLKRHEQTPQRWAAAYNDHRGNTRKQLSAWFEEVVKQFGYDIS